MNLQERKTRIIARGEFTDHAHVITGDANVCDTEIEVFGEAKIRHILESAWLQGHEVWTKEHDDIELKKGTYKYIPQKEFDPFEQIIIEVSD